ncbi:integral membrane protein (Ytp1) [Purpureocillium lavendulum]|uniref:Integral membrane protein (Ytp1) n=1 Tax=Purpureocillium lavendulum TaxID=1247861 RepID=A0AB34FTI6_9HYPO|nr:integral membrane protein (Ytp1) [Purpureocillium lavendulum]
MHKHKEKSTKTQSTAWSAWSDWAWDDARGCHYRVRQDIHGNLDYDWADPQASTPRDMGHLAREFGHLSTTDSYEQPCTLTSSAAAGRPPVWERPLHDVPPSSHRSSCNSADHASHPAGEYTVASGADDKRSGKSKSKGTKHGSHKRSDDPGTGSSHAGFADQRYEYAEESGYYTSDPRTPSAYGSTTQGYTMAAQSNIHEPRSEEEIQAAIAASQSMYYGQHQESGESSTSAYGAYYDDEDEGPPTPRPRVTAEEELPAEEMDPRYRVEHSSKFQPGEIFKVYWSEPQGAGNDYAPSVSGRQEIQNRFGTKFFVGFRRFIVVANDLGHSTCVPILTYGGKACKKKGVKPAKHGIVYERGHKARPLDKEPPLGFPPVKVQMHEEGERLSKESRVNYSKLVTVEHNVKVFFIGSIVGDDWDLVQEAVNQCWEQKNRHKKRR